VEHLAVGDPVICHPTSPAACAGPAGLETICGTSGARTCPA
jgi:hypothetical protein